MKTIILCNQSRGLGKSLRNIPGPLRYISFVDTQESREICTLLRDMPGAKELPRAKLFRERRGGFRKKYIEFVGQLNIQNHSPEWWAMPFTNKNPAATTLCRNTFYFLLTAELASNDATNLVVISDSVDLAAQLKTWGRAAGFQVKDLIRAPGRLRRFLKRYTPAGIVRSVVLTFFLWTRARKYRPAINSREAHLVIASIAHPRSFSAPGIYKDAYFGPLVDHLAGSKHKALVLAMLLEQPIEQLKQLRGLNNGIPVVPLEACFTLRDFVACAGRAFKAFFQPVSLHGPAKIDGLDLSCLVERAIRDTRRSGDIFMSLRVYYCGRWLARNLHVKRCLYPYENRAWEKMLIQGMRSSSPQTELVGYQHAAIALSETNYIMAEGEAQIVPLPNTILTTGDIAGEWLEKEGNYPPGMFKNACALRQGQPAQHTGKTWSNRLIRVFVALGLGAGAEEYLLTLTFLDKAFADHGGYDLRIRPHPQLNLDPVLKIVPLDRQDFFTPSTSSLAEDLEWADVALYASSTVGLEAMSLGIPVVHMDLGDFLDHDTMFGWDEVRWSVEDPSQLVDTIQQIARLPESEFQAREKNGREYAAAYLEPVTADGLQRFLE